MNPDGVSEAEQRIAVVQLARAFGQRGYRILLLGSTAVLLKTDRGGLTKDVDLHIPPHKDYTRFFDDVMAVANALDAPPPPTPAGRGLYHPAHTGAGEARTRRDHRGP